MSMPPQEGNWLTPRRAQASALAPVPGDYQYIESVVRIGYPVQQARIYLNRHLGNPIGYRLVAARRGEKLGHVREAEVQPAVSGPTVHVRSVRTLPDGSPASYFAPDDLIESRATVEMEGAGEIPPLQPNDRIVLHIPVKSYLRFLPGIYQGAVPTQRRDVARSNERSVRQWGARTKQVSTAVQVHHADQYRRFLFLFQHLMTTVTQKIDGIPDLTDPMSADPKFLPWIASWVNFELDESLPLHQQRDLVKRSIRLYRTRGTKAGIEDMIRVLTSAGVSVEERRRPQPCVLNGMTLAGGRNISERYLRGEPPGHFLVRPNRAKTTFFVLKLEDRDAFRRRFGERATTVLRRISQIVTSEKPGHVTFTIEFDDGIS